MESKPKVFLSYARDDLDGVLELRLRLIGAGFEPWMDTVDLKPGQQWDQEIPKVIRSSDFVIVVLSQTSVAKRGFVQREFKLALEAVQEVPEDRIFLIPVLLSECAVPESFRRYAWVTLPREGEFERLCDAMRSQTELPGGTAACPTRPSTRPSPSAKLSIATVNDIAFEFVQLSAGTLQRETSTEDGKRIVRTEIGRPFQLSRFPVTQEQWRGLMRGNPSYFQKATCPVERVTWLEVQRFLQRLNRLDQEWDYRLPTEDEWEYAGRAGSPSDSSANLSNIAWYLANSEGRTHPVGRKGPNPWGLFDMLGNVWEWLASSANDMGADLRSRATAQTVPSRVLKGGAWDSTFEMCSFSIRESASVNFASRSVGFRLLRRPRRLPSS